MSASKQSWKANTEKGFSLIELLVVIAIIGLLASVTLPALKGIGRSNALVAANRQLLDDLALARLMAINHRTTVYFVFLSPEIMKPSHLQNLSAPEKERVEELRDGIYTGYAIYAKRRVGSQPGEPMPQYLSDWKFLPQGVFFGPYQFLPPGVDPDLNNLSERCHGDDPIKRKRALIRFPRADSPPIRMHTIAFNAQGQLGRDEVLTYYEGVLEFDRDQDGKVRKLTPIYKHKPPSPQAEQGEPHRVRIDWLTGRARVVEPPEPQ
ncbi:MAG: hypothetical protein M2R45_03063 [Verrucomicrobia subdivision 3 bacterium]|nr:hypothetical protein [Limisphaerales bacterium]MCS1416549.1 hypothetical protein [Limisphaerales bacterium]